MSEAKHTPAPWEAKIAHLIAAARDLLEAHDPDLLEAVADEIGGEFKHSARAESLRVRAREQRAAIAKATGKGDQHD